jgi:hypothetical protein
MVKAAQKITLAGIDISDKAAEWNENYPSNQYPLRRQFTAALAKAATIEELQSLKNFLLEHKTELKDVMPLVQESSGDNVRDMADHIDECIYNIKHNRNVV